MSSDNLQASSTHPTSATAARAEPRVPEALEAEQSLLGALILAPEIAAPAARGLDVGVFYREPHRIIYAAIVSLLDRGTPVDLITLADELRNKGEFDRAGGGEYLQLLASAVPTARNAPHYARLVSEAARKRALMALGEHLLSIGRSSDEESEALILDAQVRLAGIRDRGLSPEADPPPSGADVLPWSARGAAEFRRSASPQVWPISDQALGQFWSLLGGGLPRWVLLSGQPSAGKSSLALQVMLASVREPGSAAVYLSVDMPAGVMWRRLLCLATGLSWREIAASDRWSGDDGLLRASESIGPELAARIAIVGSDQAPLPRLLQAVRAHRRRTGAGRVCVVVDYLQALPLPAGLGDRQGTSDIARDEARVDAMRALAESGECASLVLVSEARKPAQGRRQTGWAESLADVRGSARIVYAPDAVVSMLRRGDLDADDESGDPGELDPDREHTVILRVHKSREGRLGDVRTFFSPSTYSFRAQGQ